MKKLTKRQQAEKLVKSMEYIAKEAENVFGRPLSNWGYNPDLVIRCAKGLLDGKVDKSLVIHLLGERNHLAKAGNEVCEMEDISPIFDVWENV